MRKFIPLSLLLFLLTACVTATPTEYSPTSALSGQLMPYQSPTPSLTLTPALPAATIAATPLPSATPFTHTIEKDDTLLGIAFHYGVSLEELQAANPGVDPGFLVIGQSLIIPLEGEPLGELVIPTPLPLARSAPVCYPSADEGLWCFILVTNDQSEALENISGWTGLYDGSGNLIAGQEAIPPLNRLPPGASMPLISFFTKPLLSDLQAQGQLLTALPIEAGDVRYLDVEIEVENVQVAVNGLQATARGQVNLPRGSAPSSVWVVAIAYGEDGRVVGVRKLDLGAPCGEPQAFVPTHTSTATLAVGSPTFTPLPTATKVPKIVCTPFSITVYSLGPEIQRVEILVEARP